MTKEKTKAGSVPEILPPTDDWVFKLLFGDERNKSMLIDLLQSLVELPKEEFELTYLDTHLKKEFEDDKLGIVDVKVKTASGKIINIEIQVNPEKFIGCRISFYKSKMVAEQIGEGSRYDLIQKVICILITSFPLFPDDQEYLNSFRFSNLKNNLTFEDIPEEIITLEIPKIPEYNDGSTLYDWLHFLKANRKEDYEMAAERNPEIRKAVNTLLRLSNDERVRAEYTARLIAKLDRNSQLHEAREEGRTAEKLETARRMKNAGRPLNEIEEFTGLSLEEIQGL